MIRFSPFSSFFSFGLSLFAVSSLFFLSINSPIYAFDLDICDAAIVDRAERSMGYVIDDIHHDLEHKDSFLRPLYIDRLYDQIDIVIGGLDSVGVEQECFYRHGFTLLRDSLEEEYGVHEHYSPEVNDNTKEIDLGLQSLTDVYQPYRSLLGADRAIGPINLWGEHVLLGLSDALYHFVLFDLRSAGLLTNVDVSDLATKVSFAVDPKLGCGLFRGEHSYTSKGGTGLKVFDGITFFVSDCLDRRLVFQYEQVFKRLALHEVGHYLHAFKDDDGDRFASLCWDGDSVVCDDSGFVSRYAQQNADEDYAESFADFRLGLYPSSHASSILLQKQEYMSLEYGLGSGI